MRSVTRSVTENPRFRSGRISQSSGVRGYGFALNVFVMLLGSLAAGYAIAVPIPWKNCGKPTDLLSISKSDVSVWPPPVAAPVNATATFDTAGALVNLRVFLVHGFAWTFDTGPLPTSASAGFVSLPASFPAKLVKPQPPIPAGPVGTNFTFGGHQAAQVSVSTQANLKADLTPPATATLGLSFDGQPGFPLQHASGAYAVHVQLSASGGADIFCADFTVPLKTGTLVGVVGASNVPSLSRLALALVALLVGICGMFGVRSMAVRRAVALPR